jgi:hypothetical protein
VLAWSSNTGRSVAPRRDGGATPGGGGAPPRGPVTAAAPLAPACELLCAVEEKAQTRSVEEKEEYRGHLTIDLSSPSTRIRRASSLRRQSSGSAVNRWRQRGKAPSAGGRAAPGRCPHLCAGGGKLPTRSAAVHPQVPSAGGRAPQAAAAPSRSSCSATSSSCTWPELMAAQIRNEELAWAPPPRSWGSSAGCLPGQPELARAPPPSSCSSTTWWLVPRASRDRSMGGNEEEMQERRSSKG